MVSPTIQSIFLIGYAAYEKAHLLPEFVRKAAHSIMVCRTAVLGGIHNPVRKVIITEYGTIPVNTGYARNALI